MALRIGTNINSLIARRYLEQTGRAIAKNSERLSTGRRINFARDDASGLAVSNGLESQRRSFQRSLMSINESKSYLDSVESAIKEQSEIVQRMRELALQASNGVLADKDRGLLNEELNQLYAEFQRISETSSYNGNSLLATDSDFSVFVGASRGEHLEERIEASISTNTFKREIGNGGFELQSTQSIGSGIREVLVDDLNGDGYDDKVISSTVDDLISVFLNDGSGQFELTQTIAIGVSTEDIELGDYDNDGLLDLVIGSSGVDGVTLLKNNGSGSFNFDQTLSVTATSTGVVVADIDGDGVNDIVASRNSGGASGRMAAFIGQGNGAFDTPIETIAPQNRTSANDLHAGDLDGDGRAELLTIPAALLPGSSNVIGWNGTDFVVEGFNTITNDNNPLEHQLIDFDGDGDLDILSAIDGAQSASIEQNIALSLNDGSGNFTKQVLSSFAGNFTSIQAMDINDDGKLDIVATGSGRVVVGLQNSLTDFQFSQQSVDGLTGIASLGDFDNDGIFDLYAADSSGIQVLAGETTATHRASDISIAYFYRYTNQGTKTLIGS